MGSTSFDDQMSRGFRRGFQTKPHEEVLAEGGTGHEVAGNEDRRCPGETGDRPERERAGERPSLSRKKQQRAARAGKDLYAMLALSSDKALGILHVLPNLVSESADKCNSKQAR